MLRFSTFSHSFFYLLFGVFFTTFAAHAHLFKAEKWSSDTQDILLVSDFHRSTTPENQCQIKQRQEIVDFAAKMGAGVIVEDGMIYGDAIVRSSSVHMEHGVFPAHKLEKIPIEIPLHGMHSLCIAQGVDSINVEYRFSQCRPLSVYYTFFKNKKEQFLKNFNDGPAQQNYYAQTIQALENDIEKPLACIFEQFQNKECTLGEYLSQKELPSISSIDELMKKVAPQWNILSMSYRTKLETLLTNYTIAFLDMEIVHALSTFKNKKTIVVCAGNHHIDNIKKVLPSLGYCQEQTFGQELRLSNGVRYIEPKAIHAWETLMSMSQEPSNTTPWHYFNSFVFDNAYKLWNIFYA